MIKSRAAAGNATVTFTLDPGVGARTAAVCGEWNNWSADAGVMRRGAEGGFTLTVDLEAGRAYRFRYLLDGERWDNDWAADAYVPNSFGADDSVVDLTALAGAVRPAAKEKAPAKEAAAKEAAAKEAAGQGGGGQGGGRRRRRRPRRRRPRRRRRRPPGRPPRPRRNQPGSPRSRTAARGPLVAGVMVWRATVPDRCAAAGDLAGGSQPRSVEPDHRPHRVCRGDPRSRQVTRLGPAPGPADRGTALRRRSQMPPGRRRGSNCGSRPMTATPGPRDDSKLSSN